ncbi:YdaU family protein [Undibacterium sp. MH2W]|uniref:YdaU family protein n=1 Tax=Undibacterium sp. MH2W TaxID=3413044 RepID=UPI003BEF7609
MHYYEHNIGDYRRDTGHLSLLEHGIYRSLIDTYYLTQQPLCSDIAKLMRAHCVRTADEQKALENVLSDFFVLTDRGYEHRRCEAVIAEYAEKSAKSKKAAEARWAKNSTNDAESMQTQCERIPDAMPTINHKPITINHKPLKTTTSAEAQKFDFAKSVIELGADPKTVSDWMKVRKAKKGANTETALAGFVREAAASGLSVADAVLLCAERSWVGINADWLKPKSQASPVKSSTHVGFDKIDYRAGVNHDGSF